MDMIRLFKAWAQYREQRKRRFFYNQCRRRRIPRDIAERAWRGGARRDSDWYTGRRDPR